MTIRGNFGARNVLPYSAPSSYLLQSTMLPTVVQNGLVGFWPLNLVDFDWDGSQANSRYVELISGNSVVPSGTVNPDVSGIFDSGVKIDGTSGGAGFLKESNSNASPTGSGSRTWCGWVLATNFSTIIRPFNYGNFQGGGGLWQVDLNANPSVQNPAPAQCVLFSMDLQLAYGATSLVAGIPYHVAVATTTNANNAKIYLNGKDDTSGSTGSEAVNTFANQKYMFGQWQSGQPGGLGVTWDARLYNRVLSVNEILDIYNAGLSQNLSGAWAQFNEMPILPPPPHVGVQQFAHRNQITLGQAS